MTAIRSAARALLALAACLAAPPAARAAAAQTPDSAPPRLHHVGLNSVDPERAIAWYLRLWPTARRVEVAGLPGVQAEMLLLFTRVRRPAPGRWSDSLHRAEPQSAFWHIGAFTNTSTAGERMRAAGVAPLPLFTGPHGRASVPRSGLAPYAGTLTAAQLATADSAPPREGGFSYVVAPDGVLFELTGGASTRDSFSHVHFFHERPRCAANWYAEQLGMPIPPTRDSAGRETPHARWDPCDAPPAEATWPALEPGGTIRQPAGGVRYGDGSMSWYPRQCTGTRCGRDRPLVPSRGQVLDHVAFSVTGLDALVARLRRNGVRVLAAPHPFGRGRAAMIEDPDGLSIELVEEPGGGA